MIEEYKNLVKEVENFIDEVERCDEVQKSRVKYYKGAQILYSALHKNPKYMFIGINPGNGYFKQNNGKLLSTII